MTSIATYVFLDLETTSLPKFENNKTRITELSMVAVLRQHLLDTRPGAAPRVLNKLSMCFNPGRMIHPDSTEITGLCNDLLEENTPFNMNVFHTINSFLQCLKKPVCLVAENGHSFDFPILKNHFEKLGVQLSDDILCGDSLYSFYDILEATNGVTNKEGNESLVKNGEEEEMKTSDTPSSEASPKNENSQSEEFLTEDVMKHFNENDELKFQQSLQEQNNRTPEQKPKKTTLTKIKKVKRRIFFENHPKPAQSYKLKDIYVRVLNRPPNEAHRAENDCLMAMEISVGIGQRFVEYMDEEKNQCKFNVVKAMTPGVPLGLLVLTGVLWGCTNPFIRQGTKGLRDVTATTLQGQVWAEVTFLLGNWKYVLPWLVNQTGSLSYLAALQRAPLSVAVPTANSLAFVCTALTGVAVGAEEPLDTKSIAGIVLIMLGTALCCFEDKS